VIEIDGGEGEGGGQVLRTALSVAAALGRAFTLDRVRHNRKPPGLKPQHLEGVLACAALSKARVEGARLASNRVVFEPTAKPVSGEHRFEIKTAGATGLLLQATAFPLWLAGAPSTVVLTGGTHVEHAPSFDDLDLGWRPLLARAGFRCTLALERTGYYPRGGGLVRAALEPAQPIRLDLSPGVPRQARIVARSSSLPEHVAERLVGRARERLEKRLGVPLETTVHAHGGPPGCAVTVAVELEGGGLLVARGLGEKGKPSERVADEACDAVLADLHAGGSVDEHLADQLLLPLALGEGGSYVTPRITDHLTTNRDTLALVLPEARVSIEADPDASCARVRVEGSHAAR
jgi:RNA 3'-terminal phosphate cyclase (ATP)